MYGFSLARCDAKHRNNQQIDNLHNSEVLLFSALLLLLQAKSFPPQQLALPFQSAGEAAELFVRCQNAMAWNQDRNRVRAARATHGANGFGPANPLRDFAVAFRFAGGNLPQLAPDGLL